MGIMEAVLKGKLIVLSATINKLETADPTRFFTDNLLSPEDWGARSEAPGEERAVARHGPEARGKAAEGERGRLGGRRAHL